METTMFTLGVLSMILAALVAIVVYGIVMVSKLKTETRNIYQQLHENHRDVYHAMDDVRRDINMIESTMHNQIQYASTQSTSYTDKRIDKLVDTYFMVKDAEQTNKKLIKG
jgi:hypothetical protein